MPKLGAPLPVPLTINLSLTLPLISPRGRRLDEPDHQQHPRDDQGQPGNDVRQFYKQLLPWRSAGGAGLMGRDREYLRRALSRIGNLRCHHDPDKPGGQHNRPNRDSSGRVRQLEEQDRHHDEQDTVPLKPDMSAQRQPGIRRMRHDQAP
jgi:hypothetical protein